MKDLTKGSPIKLILMFALPVLLGNVFQQFYNLVDTMMVGKILGIEALAAMGATGSISGLVLGLSMGITVGFSILIAQYYGAKDMELMRKAVAGTVYLSVICGIVITIISLLLNRSILELLGTPSNIIETSYGYLFVIFSGTMISILYNTCASILRALGDSKSPLYFLIIGTVLNIILDYVCIAILHMGVAGAAYATLISQAFSVLLCVIYIMKKYPILMLKKEDFKFPKGMLMNQFSMGVSMGLMNSIVSIGSVILQSAVNGMGSTIIAGHTAARKISEMFMQPMVSIGIAATTFASQNIGAGHIDRIKEGIKKSVLVSFIWATFTIILSFTGIRFFILIMLDASEVEAIQIAEYYLRINSIFYYSLAALFIYRNVLQGIGKKTVPIISSIIEMIVKVVATFLLVPSLGYLGIAICEPIAWVLMTVILMFFFYQDERFKNKSKKVNSIDEQANENNL